MSTKMSQTKPEQGNPDKNFQLNLRLWLSGAAFVHLVFLSLKLLTIDFGASEDPRVRIYDTARWQLITCWFNLLMMVYFPMSFYCDWREKRSEHHSQHVRMLNSFRHVVFCSILVPTTTFADTMFWRLWNKDRELIAPLPVDEYAPLWTHHCMHTVSLVVVLLDLVLVPRERPTSVKVHLAILLTWITAYLATIFSSWCQGIYVYPLFGNLTGLQIILFSSSMLTEHLLYYFLQWCIVDLISWSKKSVTGAKEHKSITDYNSLSLNKKSKYL